MWDTCGILWDIVGNKARIKKSLAQIKARLPGKSCSVQWIFANAIQLTSRIIVTVLDKSLALS
jgi:hypothetical protein